MLCENPAEAGFQKSATALRRRQGTLCPLEPPLKNDHTGPAWNRGAPASRCRQWIRCRLRSHSVSVANSQSCRKDAERTRIAVIRPGPNPDPRLFHSGADHTAAFNRSTPRDVRTGPGADVVHASRRDRRLIQATTVRPPAIRTDTRPHAARVRARFRRTPLQPRMRSMTVRVPLEIKKLRLQISRRPEEGGLDIRAEWFQSGVRRMDARAARTALS